MTSCSINKYTEKKTFRTAARSKIYLKISSPTFSIYLVFTYLELFFKKNPFEDDPLTRQWIFSMLLERFSAFPRRFLYSFVQYWQTFLFAKTTLNCLFIPTSFCGRKIMSLFNLISFSKWKNNFQQNLMVYSTASHDLPFFTHDSILLGAKYCHGCGKGKSCEAVL